MVATYRIPAGTRREPVRATARIIALADIVEAIPSQGVRIEQRVQEPQGRHARSEALVVQQRDDAGEGRAGGARAVHGVELPVADDDVVDGLRGDVGVAAPRGVVPARVAREGGERGRRGEVGGDGGGLVGGLGEEVREPAGGEGRGELGGEAVCAPDGCDAVVSEVEVSKEAE